MARRQAGSRWIAVFKNAGGGELDRVEAPNEQRLKVLLIDKLDVNIGWTLGKGDTIEIIEGDE